MRVVFGGKERFFGLSARPKIIILINLSNIHIRICENVFLTINTRWCKMKVKVLK
jgi:hypothetical protein